MYSIRIYILTFALLALAVPAVAQQTAPQPDESAAAPTTQPDELAAPTTRPDAQVGTRVGLLITRNLPENLQRRNRMLISQMPSDARMRFDQNRSILAKADAELQKNIRERKAQFDELPDSRQDYYRTRAQQIDEVLRRLTPTEKSRLLSMPPQERAKKMLELIAKLKAEQAHRPHNQDGDAEPEEE